MTAWGQGSHCGVVEKGESKNHYRPSLYGIALLGRHVDFGAFRRVIVMPPWHNPVVVVSRRCSCSSAVGTQQLWSFDVTRYLLVCIEMDGDTDCSHSQGIVRGMQTKIDCHDPAFAPSQNLSAGDVCIEMALHNASATVLRPRDTPASKAKDQNLVMHRNQARKSTE